MPTAKQTLLASMRLLERDVRHAERNAGHEPGFVLNRYLFGSNEAPHPSKEMPTSSEAHVIELTETAHKSKAL